MTTGHRIRLYSVGFIIGCVLVYFYLFRGQDRSYWLPENRVKEQIAKSKINYSSSARCIMECKNISEKEILAFIKSGEVNFEESDTQKTPCPNYVINGISGNQKLKVLITPCVSDSTAEIAAIIPSTRDWKSENDTCNCK